MMVTWLLLFSYGCVRHIHPYTPKKRSYKPFTNYQARVQVTSDGALWQEYHQGNYLFQDARARRPGDIFIIEIEESAAASRNASTDLSKESSIEANAKAVAGFLAALQQVNPNFNRDKILSAGSKNQFKGLGKTSRSEQMVATVPASVREVMANGNIFIEGQRVVLLNNEEHHFYISGIVRPIDIDSDNRIKSALIADAQIEFTGRGPISDKQNQGWFSTIMDWVWPF